MGIPNLLHASPLTGTSIGTAETTLTWQGGSSTFTDIDIGYKRIEQLTLRIANIDSATDLNSLKIYGKLYGSSAATGDGWLLLASATADYAGTANPWIMRGVVLTTSTSALADYDLTSIAKAQTGYVVLRTAGLQSVKVSATTASGTAVVTAWAHGSTVASPLGSPLAVVPASGLPTQGIDVAGADAYATVVTAPARVTHYAHIQVSTKAATVSFDGGTTDHFDIPLGTQWLFEGLEIPAGALIQGKNETAGQNYANLIISVW